MPLFWELFPMPGQLLSSCSAPFLLHIRCSIKLSNNFPENRGSFLSHFLQILVLSGRNMAKKKSMIAMLFFVFLFCIVSISGNALRLPHENWFQPDSVLMQKRNALPRTKLRKQSAHPRGTMRSFAPGRGNSHEKRGFPLFHLLFALPGAFFCTHSVSAVLSRKLF